MTTQRSRPLQPELRVRCDARQSGPEATPAQQIVEPFADTAGRPDPGPSWPRLPAAPTRSTKSPVQTPRTRNARTPTPGHRTSTPDSGQRIVDITCADTGRSPGHRTPDTGRVDATEYSDRATSTRQAPDRHPGAPRPPDRPLGRRTVDLWTAPAALGNDDDSATMRCLPARDYLQHYQGLLSRSVGQAAPWRIALLGRLRVERRAARRQPSGTCRAGECVWREVQRVLGGACSGLQRQMRQVRRGDLELRTGDSERGPGRSFPSTSGTWATLRGRSFMHFRPEPSTSLRGDRDRLPEIC
jgi:hypothetical protein